LGLTGLVGYGIRELFDDEQQYYCDATYRSIIFDEPPMDKQAKDVRFLYELGIRAFTSGCYYYSPQDGKWSSYGTEVGEVDIYETHCRTNHLTEFAAGLLIVPNKIDFAVAFAEAEFIKNPTIYLTAISVIGLYIICALIARIWDSIDLQKIGITPLPDNDADDKYFYEIIVYTGSRSEAATDSKVRVILTGDNYETSARILCDPYRKVFRRGGVDSFVMAVKRPLGNLSWLRVWHDNTGSKDMASWFLKHVIVHDLQSREKFYFICENWLAVERGDFQVDRSLQVATSEQKEDFKYLTMKTTKESFADEHMWYSVLTRPPRSSFTRCDRVTCCFFFIYITMLWHILYYELYYYKTEDYNSIKFASFSISPEQSFISLAVCFLSFMPTFIIIELYKRVAKRTSRTKKLKEIVNDHILYGDRKVVLENPDVVNFKNLRAQQVNYLSY
jgi:polycystin 1L2